VSTTQLRYKGAQRFGPIVENARSNSCASWATVAVMSCLLVSRVTGAAPAPHEQLDKIDAFVRGEMKRGNIPGVALGIFKKGQVLVAKGYGFANLEHRVPVTPESIFQSASVGKQFTAVAVMLEVEDGKLALDDSITKYFTDAPPSWRPITVRHLLTHTSGLAEYSDGLLNGGAEPFDSRRDYTEDGMRQAFYGLPLEFEPGSRWHYSNTGYALLGFLVHRVSGRFYGDVLKERVFQPLGMRTARIISEEDIVLHRAAGYRLVKGELKNQEWYSPSVNTTADGSLYLSLRDFLAWDRGLRARAILTPQSWAEIYTPVKLNGGKTYPYGFGWHVDQSGSKPWYHHPGDSQGFATYISRYLAEDLTIVVLTNLADSAPSRIVDGVAGIVAPKQARLWPTTPVTDMDPAATNRVRGLLRAIADGPVPPRDLLYEGRGLPEQIKGYTELLHSLGPPRRLTLMNRRDLGDDRAYSYTATYPAASFRVYLVLAPDGRVADCDVQPVP
jgi:CubicO group peptidase (beta-lactamase class C family)